MAYADEPSTVLTEADIVGEGVCGVCIFHDIGGKKTTVVPATKKHIAANWEGTVFNGHSGRPNGKCRCAASKFFNVTMGYWGTCDSFKPEEKTDGRTETRQHPALGRRELHRHSRQVRDCGCPSHHRRCYARSAS